VVVARAGRGWCTSREAALRRLDLAGGGERPTRRSGWRLHGGPTRMEEESDRRMTGRSAVAAARGGGRWLRWKVA
jgi:hypothetical protein